MFPRRLKPSLSWARDNQDQDITTRLTASHQSADAQFLFIGSSPSCDMDGPAEGASDAALGRARPPQTRARQPNSHSLAGLPHYFVRKMSTVCHSFNRDWRWTAPPRRDLVAQLSARSTRKEIRESGNPFSGEKFESPKSVFPS